MMGVNYSARVFFGAKFPDSALPKVTEDEIRIGCPHGHGKRSKRKSGFCSTCGAELKTMIIDKAAAELMDRLKYDDGSDKGWPVEIEHIGYPDDDGGHRWLVAKGSGASADCDCNEEIELSDVLKFDHKVAGEVIERWCKCIGIRLTAEDFKWWLVGGCC